ncbi:MAG: hypothetical protein ACJA2W_002114 [Planctomycetota bacterium]|jgi:hypothetical protein
MKLVLSSAALALFLASPAAAQSWDEAVDGDLSNDRLAPTSIVLNAPMVSVTAAQQGNALGLDRDYLTVEVPAGQQWSGLMLTSYTATGNNLAFMGLQAGTEMTVDPMFASPADLLGGLVYGNGEVGTDILPAIGTLNNAIGFTPPLPSGSYTFWLNQTGGTSTLALSFLVEPTSLGTNYCSPAVNNSTGQPGILTGMGSRFLALDEFSFTASQLPQNAFAYGLGSAVQGFVMGAGGSAGDLCVSGPVGRFIGQIQSSGTTGTVTTVVDLSAMPQPTGPTMVFSGQAWNFQVWHRDLSGGSVTSNFTDALSVTFL